MALPSADELRAGMFGAGDAKVIFEAARPANDTAPPAAPGNLGSPCLKGGLREGYTSCSPRESNLAPALSGTRRPTQDRN